VAGDVRLLRRWQTVVATSVTGAAMVLGFGSVLPGRLSDQTPIANPFGLAGTPGALVAVGFAIGLALHLASLLAALVCVVLQFRSSVGAERQQLRWVAAGAATAVAGLLLSTLIALGVAPRIADLIVNAALVCPPAAVSVAVLRYRLWDLDRLVSRTVTYALVTGLLVVPAAGRLAAGTGSLGVAAATLVAWRHSRRCADGSRNWSTAASTGAATTPPAPWTGSRSVCATRSTWTSCEPSCWRWSIRPCSRPRRRCGCAHRRRHGHPRNRSAS
jgi:hypothetical protein